MPWKGMLMRTVLYGPMQAVCCSEAGFASDARHAAELRGRHASGQILRYEYGQSYGAHYDSLHGDSPRIATVLMYLNDDPLLWGGETAFPEARPPKLAQCASYHVDTVLWHVADSSYTCA